MSVHIDDRTPPFGTATKVLAPKYVWMVPTYAGRMYDVSPDGTRFLMMKRADVDEASATRTNIIVVQNWFEELKRILP